MMFLHLRIAILIFLVSIDSSYSFLFASHKFPDIQRSASRNSAINMMQVWLDGSSSSTNDVDECVPQKEEESPDILIVNDGYIPKESSTVCWYKDGDNLKDANTKKIVGILVRLEDGSGQERAMAALGSVDWVLVESTSWQMIPAENLIVAAQSSGTKLCFSVEKASDVAGFARSLELGVDALCINYQNANFAELWNAAVCARRERKETMQNKETASIATHPRIVSGSCWRRETKGIVLADRVCVDLVQTLLPEEGCWIGSSAKTMALVLSESASSQFVPTRPFRVNAGPVHSYILMADNSTKYLCELNAADQVSVYNSKTACSRGVAVGRLKQEIRPCILVELQESNISKEEEEEGNEGNNYNLQQQQQKGQIFLQQAETVRLGQEDGEFIRVTELEAQKEEPSNLDGTANTLLLRLMSTGTHVGKAYTGKVKER